MGNTMGAWEAHIAIRHGDISLLKEQLNIGKLNANMRFRGETLLCTAINQNQPAIVQLLLDQGADPNFKSKENGRNESPLITATRLKNLKIVQILLENRADMNCTNFYGNDVIFQAVKENAFGILEYLLSNFIQGSSRHSEGISCPVILSIKHAPLHPLKKICLCILLKYNYTCQCLLLQNSESTSFNKIFCNEFYSKTYEPDIDVLKWIFLSKGIEITYSAIDESHNNKNICIILPLKLKLVNLARIEIRQCISTYCFTRKTTFASEVLKLPMPSVLINFLLMTDVT